MLKNINGVCRLIGGCYTNYIRHLPLYNNGLGSSFTESTVTSNVSLGKRFVEDRCYDSPGAQSATSAPQATALHGIYDTMDEEKEVKKQKNRQEELTRVEEGDILDLRKLLFTKDRDYLIRNDGNQVKAEQLAGKVVIIYFVLLPLNDYSDLVEMRHTEMLKDIYNYLPLNKGFEIVFVAVDDVDVRLEEKTDLENHYEDVFACMPWTAIPFSDITSRRRIKRRFGCYSGSVRSFVIDPTGVVTRYPETCFERYGVLGYPFSKEWLTFLNSECKAIATQPTLKNLLSSPERDYVISNNGDKVPIHTLEGKVVALYFYGESTTETDRLTLELKKAYLELANRGESFEVVLLYLYDTVNTFGHRNEYSFWKTFRKMPWLALPYKDPDLKKLKRIYEYPEYSEDCCSRHYNKEISKLVIVGPRGEFCEPFGADIILNFELPGYPFTREKALKLENERIKKLKIEMIWEPDTIFSRKDGSQVSLSQLSGKRIMLLFGSFEDEFLNILEERYLHMKGTNGEFEVIHAYLSDTEEDVQDSNTEEDVQDPLWFVYPLPKGYVHAADIIPSEFDKRYYRGQDIYDVGAETRLLAFDRDGMIVRDSAFPTIEDSNFPFYTSGLKKEHLLELDSVFDWYEWEHTESWNRVPGYVGPNQSCG